MNFMKNLCKTHAILWSTTNLLFWKVEEHSLSKVVDKGNLDIILTLWYKCLMNKINGNFIQAECFGGKKLYIPNINREIATQLMP